MIRKLITLASATVMFGLGIPAVVAPAAQAATCYTIFTSDVQYQIGDYGLGNLERVDNGTHNTACFTFDAVGPVNVYILRINGGSDCLKEVYPSTGLLYDEPCNIHDPLEQIIRVLSGPGTWNLCAHTDGQCFGTEGGDNASISDGSYDSAADFDWLLSG
jgi:hypothetical protein